MKKKIIFIIIFISIIISAQNKYQDGYQTGFKAGYCYGKIGCVAPIAPYGPADIKTDYQTGYNNGFVAGNNKQKELDSNQYFGGASKYGNIKTYVPDRTQEYINDGVNRLMQEQMDRDKVKRENERKELEKQANSIQEYPQNISSSRMNQDDIDFYKTVFEKPIYQNEIKSSSKKEKIKPAEKKNLKLELENKFYDENSLVNQWIISLKEKLVNQYGESEKINSAMQELRDENNLIFDKYFEKKNLPEFYREANILKNKILYFKLE